MKYQEVKLQTTQISLIKKWVLEKKLWFRSGYISANRRDTHFCVWFKLELVVTDKKMIFFIFRQDEQVLAKTTINFCYYLDKDDWYDNNDEKVSYEEWRQLVRIKKDTDKRLGIYSKSEISTCGRIKLKKEKVPTLNIKLDKIAKGKGISKAA